MGITNLLYSMAIVAAIAGTFEATTAGHASLRQRQLACVKKGRAGCEADADCCGDTLCGSIDPDTGAGICCLQTGSHGCDDEIDNFCCSEECNVTISTCIDADYNDTDSTGGRPDDCRIHGEECFNDDDGGNTCCGEVKYLCMITSLEYETCCLPVGASGCGFDFHCCPYTGTIEDPISPPVPTMCTEARCTFLDGTFPEDDATGIQDCANKGGYCNATDEVFCCGTDSPDPRLECQDFTCCLLSGVSGCEYNTDCCDGYCELEYSTCCIPVDQSGCTEHIECCSGYCDKAAGVCVSPP